MAAFVDERSAGIEPAPDVAARNLVVQVVGDGGKIWRSTDNGGSWVQTVAPECRSFARSRSRATR
jgi:hypothetical protein